MNSNNILLDNVTINLKLLSKIPPNGRVCIYNNVLSIDDSGPLQFIRRRYYGQTRGLIFYYLQDLTNQIEECVNRVYVDNANIKERIYNLITNAIKGIQNLGITYKNDPQTIVRLDLIIEKFTNINNTIFKTTKITAPINIPISQYNYDNSSYQENNLYKASNDDDYKTYPNNDADDENAI